MSLTAPERETIISMNDEDNFIHVYTVQQKYWNKVKKLTKPKAILIREIKDDTGKIIGGEYHLTLKQISIINERTNRELTDEQKKELSERLNTGRMKNKK